LISCWVVNARRAQTPTNFGISAGPKKKCETAMGKKEPFIEKNRERATTLEERPNWETPEQEEGNERRRAPVTKGAERGES